MSRLGEHRGDGAALTADLYSRRRFLAGLGSATVAAAFLAACGDSEDDPEATAATTSSGTSTATSAASSTAPSTADGNTPSSDGVFPVTVSHKYGETQIAEEPSRVLSLGYTDHDSLLAVGVTPIATRYWFGEEPGAIFPWAQDRLTGETPEVLEMLPGELDFEAIAAPPARPHRGRLLRHHCGGVRDAHRDRAGRRPVPGLHRLRDALG